MTDEQKQQIIRLEKRLWIYGNSKRKYCSHECYIRNRLKGGDGGE